MRILYNSKLLSYKTPFGCLRQEESCTIHIDIPCHCKTKEVFLCLENDKQTITLQVPFSLSSKTDEYETYQGTFSLTQCDLYFYHFLIITADSTFTLWKEGEDQTNIEVGEPWQLTCYPKDFDTPASFQGQVMYQIFPDRFYQEGTCDLTDKIQPFYLYENKSDSPHYLPDENGEVQNNGFFGGNLKGITKKLPYLAELGTTVLYLNPIFMAHSNHRYDTADYKRIDPMLGTEEDFKDFCNQAHALGIRVLLDGVFSHTGCNSPYFDYYNRYGNGAFHHPDSPYREWYQFSEKEKYGYVCWWGIHTLPCTEELNDSFLDYIIRDKDSVINHWLNLGADGYRLDVADELPDEFIRLLYQEVKKSKKDTLVLGEVWEDASNKISYGKRRTYFSEKELDSVMNYPFMNAIIDFTKGEKNAEQFAAIVMTIAENYPKPILDCVMNSLSTHDTKRILTVLGTDKELTKAERAVYTLSPEERKSGIEKLKFAAFLQYILPGMPCIYYGDEVGLEGFEDPFNRRFFPWDQMEETLLSFYRRLGAIKHRFPALQKGDIKAYAVKEQVLVLERTYQNQRLLAICCGETSYDCFTTLTPVFGENLKQENGHISFNKNGFVLLEA